MITPLDIENKKFSKQMMNGYSVEEVDDFLDDLTVDYGKNYKEITELRAQVEELNKSLEHYKTIETTLQNTLVMAQTTAEDIKNVAKQQAEQIINEAKSSAKQQADELENQIVLKTKELDDIKKQFDIYKAKMESLLISQLELLKEVNKEDEYIFTKDYLQCWIVFLLNRKSFFSYSTKRQRCTEKLLCNFSRRQIFTLLRKLKFI